jgi:hypothetical protein
MRHLLICILIVGWPLRQAMIGARSSQAPSAEREFSCAAFPRDIGEAGLIARYGPENVRPGPVVGWDDGPQKGTILFPNEPERRIEIVWWDPETQKTLHWVRTEGRRWQSPDGMTVGTDLKSLEQRNGGPFRLAPFAREGYPGEVLSWGSGRFKSEVPGDCDVRIYLLPAEGAVRNLKIRFPLYQREFSSGHPAMQMLNPRVYQLLIRYDRK